MSSRLKRSSPWISKLQSSAAPLMSHEVPSRGLCVRASARTKAELHDCHFPVLGLCIFGTSSAILGNQPSLQICDMIMFRLSQHIRCTPATPFGQAEGEEREEDGKED